jgi:hypothetical protein
MLEKVFNISMDLNFQKKKLNLNVFIDIFQPFKLDKVLKIQRKLIVDLFRRSIFFSSFEAF